MVATEQTVDFEWLEYKKNIYLLKSDVKRWQVKRDEILSITVHNIIWEIVPDGAIKCWRFHIGQTWLRTI